MPSTQPSAGDLRERVDVLELKPAEAGWAWEKVKTTWTAVEVTGKTNLFSRVGIGARDVALTMRRQRLTLCQALRWKGLHLFLTEVTEPKPGWMVVKAAIVAPVLCRSAVEEGPGGTVFPGVLTEKYLSSAQREPQTENTNTYVLVTPKVVTLELGSLVRVGDEPPMEVKIAHTLDAFKNEYEVGRRYEL